MSLAFGFGSNLNSSRHECFLHFPMPAYAFDLIDPMFELDPSLQFKLIYLILCYWIDQILISSISLRSSNPMIQFNIPYMCVIG